MRNRFIVAVGQGNCRYDPECGQVICTNRTIEIWNCGCWVYRKHGRLQVSPCKSPYCPVLGNLYEGVNPVHVEMRIAKI